MSGPDSYGIAGYLANGSHILPVRVYFEDTDFSGFVYHASYFRWCERGRSDFLRLCGISHTQLVQGAGVAEPAAFAVRRLVAEFIKPAKIDDIVDVVTEAASIGKASVTLRQQVLRSRQTIFKLQVQCVLVSLKGRILRIPPSLSASIPLSAAIDLTASGDAR